MRQLKILHSADWHLDSTYESLSADRARTMRREARQLPALIRKIAEERGANLILLAGDLFDSALPFLESAEALACAFEGSYIPVFISPGNHDYCSQVSPWESLVLPENVHVFRENTIECVRTPLANIYGGAFTEAYSGNILEGFAATREAGVHNLMVLHADVNGTGSYCPVSERDIASSGLDYLALGHIHKPSGLRRAGGSWYSYPGCPMGRGFDETGARGVSLITLSDNGCESEFIDTSERRYEIIEVPVTGKDPVQELQRAVQVAREGDICRFVLTGESSVRVTEAVLEEFSAQKGLFAAFLRDKTTEPRTGAESEDTMRGALLRIARQQLNAQDGEMERECVSDALRFALAAIDGTEQPWEVRR